MDYIYVSTHYATFICHGNIFMRHIYLPNCTQPQSTMVWSEGRSQNYFERSSLKTSNLLWKSHHTPSNVLGSCLSERSVHPVGTRKPLDGKSQKLKDQGPSPKDILAQHVTQLVKQWPKLQYFSKRKRGYKHL